MYIRFSEHTNFTAKYCSKSFAELESSLQRLRQKFMVIMPRDILKMGFLTDLRLSLKSEDLKESYDCKITCIPAAQRYQVAYRKFLRKLSFPYGPRHSNLVLIAYASSEGSGEPAHPRCLARTSAARSYKQRVKRNLQTESQIPGPFEWLDMRS